MTAPFDPYPPAPPPTPSRRPLRRDSGSPLLAILTLILGLLLGLVLYRFWLDRGEPALEPRLVTARGDLAQEEKSTIALFEESSPSVVFVHRIRLARNPWSRVVTEIEEGTGSGFIWDDAGHIVTNYHVVENTRSARVTLWDHSTYEAEVVGRAPAYDLAVLRIDAPASKLRPTPIGTSADLRVGQRTFAIGNPFGLDQSLTTGVVSALGRQIISKTGRPIEDVIQTDAAINPGNSGGPLLDSAGRLIGINTAIYSPSGAFSGIGFAVPVDTVNRIVPQLIATGSVVRPYMGVRLVESVNRDITRWLGIQGVMIIEVEPDSPASAAGLRGIRRLDTGQVLPGDVVLTVDGERVASVDQLFAILEERNAGDVIELRVWRDGKEFDAQLTLAEPAGGP